METTKTEGDAATSTGKIIAVDDEKIRSHVDKVVRGTVEETLNMLLEEEADLLCQARGASFINCCRIRLNFFW